MINLHPKKSVIKRLVYPEIPPPVEYSLTEYRIAFIPIPKSISKWGVYFTILKLLTKK